MAGDDDLVLGLVQAGEGVFHIGHDIIKAGVQRDLVQDMMPVPEDRLARAVEEELAALGRRDIADAAVDIEGVLLLIRIAALAHPVVARHFQRQHAFVKVAVGGQVGQLGRFAQLAEVGVAQHPGVAQRRREDDLLDERVEDLVAALVLLQLDLGLGRFQELHRAMGDDIDLAIAIRAANRKNRSDPTGPVSTGSRPVVRFELHRAQRRQLATQRTGAVFWREAPVHIV